MGQLNMKKAKEGNKNG